MMQCQITGFLNYQYMIHKMLSIAIRNFDTWHFIRWTSWALHTGIKHRGGHFNTVTSPGRVSLLEGQGPYIIGVISPSL